MQNIVQKFRQSSTGFEKPGISLKFENFDELQLSYSSIFFAETSHTFSTYQYLQNGLWDFFNLISILSYLQKFKKTWFL